MSEMTMEPEQAGRKGRRVWKVFLAGFLSGALAGVLASFLVLVVLAFKYGPRSESITVDLYSGHVVTYEHFFWKHPVIREPESPHVRWAIQHQNPRRSWYVVAAGTSRAGWFDRMLCVSYTTREYVHAIYSLQLPEEEKIELLHQYHEDLDALKAKEQEYYESRKFMERFYEDWEQKLKKAAQDAQLADHPA